MSRRAFASLQATLDYAKAHRARVTEVAHVNGQLRVNVVLRSGKPQTWMARR